MVTMLDPEKKMLEDIVTTLSRQGMRLGIELIAIIGLVALGFGLAYKGCSSPVPVVTQNGNVTSVSVPKITEKVVTQFTTDPELQAEIKALLAENAKLKSQVQVLTVAVATNKVEGGVGINGGKITPVVLPVVELPKTTMVRAVDPPSPTEYTFSDFQIKATFSGKPSFTYELNQKFSLLGAHGKGVLGQPVDFVTVYQNTPTGLKKLDTQAIVYESIPDSYGWHASPRIQGGLAFPKAGVVALEWLRKGTGPEAEHTKFALLSPALTINNEGVKLGLIPVNINLGQIKHSPFTNLWVGPLMGLDKTLGATMTATF